MCIRGCGTHVACAVTKLIYRTFAQQTFLTNIHELNDHDFSQLRIFCMRHVSGTDACIADISRSDKKLNNLC